MTEKMRQMGGRIPALLPNKKKSVRDVRTLQYDILLQAILQHFRMVDSLDDEAAQDARVIVAEQFLRLVKGLMRDADNRIIFPQGRTAFARQSRELFQFLIRQRRDIVKIDGQFRCALSFRNRPSWRRIALTNINPVNRHCNTLSFLPQLQDVPK